jgi:dethiobiotin synthetase
VGKTHVAAMIVRTLVAAGRRVGVYKPAASGCRLECGELISDDAVALWDAAGRPGNLACVCPQRFLAPLAPHLAAKAEGKQLDADLLRQGIDYWRQSADVIVVEGAGGLMSPLGDSEYVADLAKAFRFPLVIVSRNVLGTINQTLQTLMTAATFGSGLPVAGVVLNHTTPPLDDASLATNYRELVTRCSVPVLAEVAWRATEFSSSMDWFALAK